MLLSETGLYKASLLSRKPKGIELRNWLAVDILPGIRRGEIVSAAAVSQIAAPLTEDQRLARRIANSESRLANKKVNLEKERLAQEKEQAEAENRMRGLGWVVNSAGANGGFGVRRGQD